MGIDINKPEPGYYMRRKVRNGPWVPARIWWHAAERDEAGDLLEDEGLRCEVDGTSADPYAEWSWLAAHPISEAEYRFMVARSRWATDHAPDDPHAAPGTAVNLGKMRPIF